jgi:ribosomal protein S18 acetylase RimI-like enzyme
MAYTYKIHRLDPTQTDILPFLAGKHSSLRLSALQVSSDAFGSTFEVESSWPASRWIKRLQRPTVNTFIAVAYSPSTSLGLQTIDSGDAIGSATLLGPFAKEDYELRESGGPEIGDDNVESKWHMTAVFNSPNHRGKGVAKMLIQAAVDFAEKEAGEGRKSRVRIMIKPTNFVVKKLYEALGFVDAGRCTLGKPNLLVLTPLKRWLKTLGACLVTLALTRQTKYRAN